MRVGANLNEEKARVEGLEASVEAWARSRRIREYLAAKEAAADPDDEALQTWLSWARDYADWLDPLTEGPPSILDEPDPFPYW
ncbi:MAG: hypothetical protein U5R46_02260 [Gammaproteobacteria bacterium]|nr:hypothetical protein [Gammaproteobacteria bacterium]